MKYLKLINNERKKLVGRSEKGCGIDMCMVLDKETCFGMSNDICKYDLTSCSNGVNDICGSNVIDSIGCQIHDDISYN